MDKSMLRKHYRQLRDGSDTDSLKRADEVIYEKLICDINVKNADVIMTYVSMGSEVDTHAFISLMLSQGKSVSVPVVRGKVLDVSYISSMDDLECGSYEILEPKRSAFRKCEPSDIDVIIVPALAFDGAGHRIGYGAGFYDRFLPLANAVKIGICYSFCVTDDIIPEGHDVSVDYIITD